MSSVGILLRETREKKKLSIEDASRATHIHKELLEALEADDYEKVPAPTYVKGFLKIYAEYLGLEPGELVGEYLKDHVGNSEQVLVLDVEGQVKPQQLRNIVAYAIIAAAVLLVLVLIFIVVRSIAGSRRGPAPLAQMEILEPLTVTVDETDLVEPVAPKPAREMELRLKATKEDVWVKVTADGVTLFQNVVKKGGEEFWRGTSGFTMKLGRPEAVALTLDGKPVTMPDRKKKPRTIRIDAEGNIEFPK